MKIAFVKQRRFLLTACVSGGRGRDEKMLTDGKCQSQKTAILAGESPPSATRFVGQC
ncbi:MAG: hypothetical protein HN392_10065 [Anaerolineae bacterium]|nr:hypothetical protein [Anaerolineae bacterium]